MERNQLDAEAEEKELWIGGEPPPKAQALKSPQTVRGGLNGHVVEAFT